MYKRFQDIPQFIDGGSYRVDVPWQGLERQLADMAVTGLEMDPDFQRAHVWNDRQRIRYVEFVLRGGRSSKDIYWNAKNWMRGGEIGACVLVDGKQRLEAVRKFLRNELKIFGHTYRSGGTLFSEFTDKLAVHRPTFSFNINNLNTRCEVLQWYCDLNAGGVAHTDEEIEKVRELLRQELKGAKNA